jgi:hypothetical protein
MLNRQPSALRLSISFTMLVPLQCIANQGLRLIRCRASGGSAKCNSVALGQLAPLDAGSPPPISDPGPQDLRRRDAAFGLIHEYRLVA